MKKIILATIILCILCFNSCAYNVTEDVRASLSEQRVYHGRLLLNGAENEVSLTILENSSCKLLFKSGAMNGVESFFSDNYQKNTLKDLSYTLSSPSQYIILNSCLVYLQSQSYNMQAQRGSVEEFTFKEEELEIKLLWHDGEKTVKEISCKGKNVDMLFTDLKEG